MVVRLFDADLLPGKHLAHVDLASLVTDAPAGRNHGGPVVARILELLEALIGASRGLIAAGGRGHLERLVRPLVVELVDEGIEAGLLLEDIRGRRACRLGLQA